MWFLVCDDELEEGNEGHLFRVASYCMFHISYLYPK